MAGALVGVPTNGKREDSKRMAALRVAPRSVGVNTCPYGCTNEEAGEYGYCHHVIGVTVGGSKTVMEPMGWDKSGRRTNGGFDALGEEIKPGRVKVLPTDHLELVTVSCLVYRKDAPKPKSPDDILADVEADDAALAELEAEAALLAGK